MLIFDLRVIGQKLLYYRKAAGLTQEELAEAAGLSPRAYADIERGSVSARLDSLLKICAALHITPNDVLTEAAPDAEQLREELIEKIKTGPAKEQEPALKILDIYFSSFTLRG